MPAATLTYPNYPLDSTDVAFNAKLMADFDAIRAFVNNAQMNTANLSATAGLVGTQVANGAITGAKVGTGANGLSGSNLQNGIITADHVALNTLGESEVDWVSASGLKARRTGVVGWNVVSGRKSFTVPAGVSFYNVVVTAATDCDYTPGVFPTTNLRGACSVLAVSDPGTGYSAWPITLTSTVYTFQIILVSTVAAWTADLDWEVEGL